MATTACKFPKIFRGSMPPDPPRASFILNMLQNDFAGKNTRDNMSKFNAPSLKKILNAPQTRKPFTPFLGLTSLYLVNIQPNSKFHLPPH